MADVDSLQIRVFASPLLVVRIHPLAYQKRNLGVSREIACKCGMRTVNAIVALDSSTPVNAIWLTSEVCTKLKISQVASCLPAQLDKMGVRIGPIVGILCNPTWNEKKQNFNQSKHFLSLEKLMNVGLQAKVQCCLFRMQDVDLPNASLFGYMRNGSDWKRTELPLPDVIYDQVVSRQLEHGADYLKKHQGLTKMYGKRIFNYGFFDKWQIYEWLTKDPRLKPHVPLTDRYKKLHAMANFIQRHDTTFLKPVHGSLGHGIIRLTKQPDGTVSYDIKGTESSVAHGKATNPDELAHSLRKRLSSRPYLVQQGIPLAKYLDRPFDIRIILQRDASTDWKRTKMFARVAKLGDFTSNLSSGGEALPVSTVFSALYPKSQEQRRCERTIAKLALMIPEVIEKQSGQVLGELGIDVGVDHVGGIWIIEVNSKPWKAPSTDRGRPDLVDLAFLRPIQYAAHLAGQM